MGKYFHVGALDGGALIFAASRGLKACNLRAGGGSTASEHGFNFREASSCARFRVGDSEPCSYFMLVRFSISFVVISLADFPQVQLVRVHLASLRLPRCMSVRA